MTRFAVSNSLISRFSLLPPYLFSSYGLLQGDEFRVPQVTD